MAVMAGAVMTRDATGNILDMANGSWAFLDCLPGTKIFLIKISEKID